MAKNDEMKAQAKQTTVEEGTEFKGTMHSKCEVVVRGVVDGDLTAPSVIVSESGTVVGNVKAECIRSEGVLAGRVDANDVYLSGSVRSDTVIRAKTLEVKLRRQTDKLEVTFGECILDVGEDPAAVAQEAPSQRADNAAQALLEELNASSKPGRQGGRRTAPPPAMSSEPASSESSEANGASEGKSDRRSVPPPPS